MLEIWTPAIAQVALVEFDVGEGRAQLMGDIGDKLGFEPIQFFNATDVSLAANEPDDPALFVQDGRDRQIGIIHRSVCTLVDNFPAPGLAFQHGLPHVFIDLGWREPTVQNTHVLADNRLSLVAGERFEGGIYIDDLALDIGNVDGVAAVADGIGPHPYRPRQADALHGNGRL